MATQNEREQEALRINDLVAELRMVANKLGKHAVLFPFADCENRSHDFGTEDCSECHSLMFGGGDIDSGVSREVAPIIRYIADMMEV